MTDSLKYRDERDRACGAAGMVVALVMTDHEDQLAEVSLDAPDGELVRLTPDVYFAANQRYSARLAWQQTLDELNLWVGMAAANVICRSYIIDYSRPGSQVENALRSLVIDEACGNWQLDEDEADRLLRRNVEYYGRVLNSRLVADCINSFISTLRSRRTLSRHEALEQLRDLGRM